MGWGFPGGSDGKGSACNAGDLGSIPGWGDPLEKEMATHCTTLAWRIPSTECLKSYSPWGHKESDTTEQLARTRAHTHTHTHSHSQDRLRQIQSLEFQTESFAFWIQSCDKTRICLGF